MFRLMGKTKGSADNTRLRNMSDGVFAIILTLMVFEVKVPRVPSHELTQALFESLPEITAVLLSFVVLGVYWIGHNNVFQHILRHDRTLLWMNILFLLSVAVVPYAAGLLVRYADTRIAHLLYGGCLAIGGGLLDVIWQYAARNRHLMRDTVTTDLIKAFHTRICVGPVLYVLAMAVSFISLTAAKVLFAAAILYYLIPTKQDLHHNTLLTDTAAGGHTVGQSL